MTGKSALAPFYRGDTKVFNLSFKDNAGTPINISGHKLWFTMKINVTDADANAVFQKEITFPENTDSENGVGALTLGSDETGTIEPGTYFFDIQKVIPGTPPIVATLLSGRVAVLSDITRRNGS